MPLLRHIFETSEWDDITDRLPQSDSFSSQALERLDWMLKNLDCATVVLETINDGSPSSSYCRSFGVDVENEEYLSHR